MEMYLTVEQTADRLQMHPVSVRRLLARGELRGVKRGRVWRIPESALGETPVQKTEIEQKKGSPISRALAMVRARDGKHQVSKIPVEQNAVSMLREIREGREKAIMRELGGSD